MLKLAQGMSESLQRARKPFLVKNALIGSSVAAFAIGVYTYAISAVKQDDFVRRFFLFLLCSAVFLLLFLTFPILPVSDLFFRPYLSL